MARDRLIIDDNDYGIYRIVWYLAENQDIGGVLGDEEYTDEQLAKCLSDEDRQHIVATIAASKTIDVRCDSNGYFWETKAQATMALRACNAALRTKMVWPEWATKASAAGWKPPKNWKP